MFIKTVKKKNKYSPKTFEYQYLVESVRAADGPRQKFLLNLGKLSLPEAEWPLVAKRIEEILRGQEKLFAANPEIERLATHYAETLLRKYETEYRELDEKHYESIDLDSITNSKLRTIGAEYVALSYFKKLELDKCLRECGFSDRELEVASLLIIGRLVSPGSERHTHLWGQKISGLDELLNTNFSQLSKNTLYKVSDKILKNKEVIEKHLRHKERDLFALDEKIILYDLTNTFLEGQAARNPKAKFGRSKEKRSDCRLLTLGLVIDGNGFPKTSKVFAGNQSEPKTLSEMIQALHDANRGQVAVPAEGKPTNSDVSPASGEPEKITVVIDAGIATEENLKELKPSYHYICVSRKQMDPPESDDFIVIRQSEKNKVEAQKITRNGEVFLYCKSQLKQKKEQAMHRRWEQLFEKNLKHLAESIHKKGCTKNYQKVCERIGRLKEKYARIAQFYVITVEEKNGLADKITWQYIKEEAEQKFSGSYYLRTDRTDLSEKQIWEIYIMLTELEDAFRAMKSELDIRPIYHQKEDRSEAHIFLTVIAYHILHSICTKLKQLKFNCCWATIKQLLSTHGRVTTRLETQSGKTIYIRKCSEPEPFHKTIYEALNLDHVPCKPKKVALPQNP
jgi:transposase